MNQHLFVNVNSLFLIGNTTDVSNRQQSNQFVRLGILFSLMTLPLWTACSRPNEDLTTSEKDDPGQETHESANQGVDFFQGSFEDALARANQNEKLLFVFVDDNSLGPGIVMKETVFSSPDVGAYVNEKFVSYVFDMENEEQYKPEFVLQNTLVHGPMYLILDAEGNTLGQANRGVRPNQFLTMISRMLGESTSTFEDIQARYDSGERSTEFIQQYLMDAILELEFLKIELGDETSAMASIEKGSKFKTIAREYFASRPYSKLINETDTHLVMFYWEHHPRGDELVEFVLEHYEEFLAVSSEATMAQFTLNATYNGVFSVAQAGDEKYTHYIKALESYPLKKAVEYEYNRDPHSDFLPERLKNIGETNFLMAKRDWDGLYVAYQKYFDKVGDRVKAWQYRDAAIDLGRSDNPTHHQVAVEFARKAYELDKKSPSIVAIYISALLRIEKSNQANRVAEDYRAGLSDSQVDKINLEMFNSMSSSILGADEDISTP